MSIRRIRWAPIWLGLIVVFLYAPLVRVGLNSFNTNEIGTSFEGFTLDWYRAAWNDVTVRDSLRVSLVLATIASALSTTIALGVVIGLRSQPRLRWMSRTLTAARLLLPEVVIAAGIAIMLPLFGIPLGLMALVIGHVVFQTAFAIVLIEARAAGQDARLVDAAADLGASPGRVLRTVVIPDLAPGIWAAALLTFLFSFDDVVLSRLLSNPDTPTLPVTVLSLINRRISPEIDAIGTVVLGVGLVVFVAAALIGRAGLATALTGGRERR
jgi:ABC-type spermidine/putrescine transport system permease subunit II